MLYSRWNTIFPLQVGYYISQFLRFLISQGLTSPNDIHILAHSLGAHVAGFIGDDFSGTIARITAMDPARIDFEAPILRDPRDRLDPTDAQFVDVIHTCAGTIGFIRAIGHADFYPNGGSFRQPGCPALLSRNLFIYYGLIERISIQIIYFFTNRIVYLTTNNRYT